MKKKILILVDMEGCTGIIDMRQYDFCREKMIEETERVIQSIEACEEAEIAVADCHNDGKNIVRYFSNKGYSCYEHIWSIQNVEKYDCAMLIGFHPKNGEEGFYPHTLRADVDELFLGEKSIGEVGLLINWLAGHGVPVVFVGGDSAVKKELAGYECVFYASNATRVELSDKGSSSEQISLSASKSLLDRMTPYVKYALDSLGEIKLCYDVSAMKVKLIGENYYKWMPQELFSTEKGMVVFPDTERFIQSLLPFCEFLNIAEEYQRVRIHYLVRKIKISGICVEKDRKGNELLNQKDWRALSDEEIGYLYSRLD